VCVCVSAGERVQRSLGAALEPGLPICQPNGGSPEELSRTNCISLNEKQVGPSNNPLYAALCCGEQTKQESCEKDAMRT